MEFVFGQTQSRSALFFCLLLSSNSGGRGKARCVLVLGLRPASGSPQPALQALIDFSPPAQRRRFEVVEGAAARPPRWGSPKEEQTAQPPQKGVAPCSHPSRPSRATPVATRALTGAARGAGRKLATAGGVRTATLKQAGCGVGPCRVVAPCSVSAYCVARRA